MRLPVLAHAANLIPWAARLVQQWEKDFIALLPASGQVTLTQNAATTTVSNPAMTAAKKVVLFPTTANAAAEVGGGTMYVSSKAAGSFVISHANSATAGRTFDYLIIG